MFFFDFFSHPPPPLARTMQLTPRNFSAKSIRESIPTRCRKHFVKLFYEYIARLLYAKRSGVSLTRTARAFFFHFFFFVFFFVFFGKFNFFDEANFYRARTEVKFFFFCGKCELENLRKTLACEREKRRRVTIVTSVIFHKRRLYEFRVVQPTKLQRTVFH